MKSCHPYVGRQNPMSVYALSWATCTARRAAPSMRLKAFSTPLSSHTAMTIGVPISWALASAAAMIRWARSLVMLVFSKVSSTVYLLCHRSSGRETLFQVADLRKADEVEELAEAGKLVKDRERRPGLADLGQGGADPRRRAEQRGDRKDHDLEPEGGQRVVVDR